MCVFEGGARGGNGVMESGTPLGDINPGDGVGLIGDEALDCVDEAMENCVGVPDKARECVRMGDSGVLVALVNVQV